MSYVNLFHAILNRLRMSRANFVLAFCWMLGLFLGAIYGDHADHSYAIMMRTAALCRVSIVGLLFLLFFPLLLSAIAVYSNHPQWMVFVCFIKAFLFASCGSLLLITFGSAAWLIRILLQFSDFCTLPFLFWFSIRNIAGRNANTRMDLVICGCAMAVMGALDFCVISPFLVSLL